MEQFRASNHAVFHYFKQPGAIFPLRQGPQHFGINQHRERLMKRTDQILPRNKIHAGLAAYSSVHLRKQRGGNLNHRNAAHEDGCKESADVGEDSAAERHHHTGPVAAGMHHLFGQFLHRGESLLVFAAIEEEHVERTPVHPGFHTLSVEIPDVSCGGNEHLPGCGRHEAAEPRQHASLDHCRVCLLARFHLIRRHNPVVPWDYYVYL